MRRYKILTITTTIIIIFTTIIIITIITTTIIIYHHQQVEVERSLGIAANLEKKERMFDKTVDEWRHKHDDLNAELDASQRDTRTLGTEVFKLKNANDEIVDQVGAMMMMVVVMMMTITM